ncbi:MAG: hypothetical protein ACTHQE_01375 [Thermomicrobiales bacterium]
MPHPAHDPGMPDMPDTPDVLDVFDTWLDALFTSPPSHPSDATAQVETDADTDASPEASAARDLRMLAAQTDAITLPAPSWKEILMASQHPTTNAPVPSPGNAHRTPTRLGATLNRIVSIAAILAIVVAGIATAWIARDRLGFGDDGHQPTLQLVASPAATVTCTTRTLSQEEADRIVATYRAQPESTSADYTPSDTPVPAADVNAAMAVLVAALSCPNGEPGSNSLLWQRSTYTDGYFAGSYLTTSPAWMAEYLARWKAELEPMSRILTPLTPVDYIVDSNDPAIQRYLISSPNLGTFAVLPDRFVAFADGRIGVPMLLAIPGGAPAYDGYIATLMVPFAIFEKVDGQWLSDGATGLCPGDCSQAEARIDAQIANYRRLATVIGSPVASPAASPEATPQT